MKIVLILEDILDPKRYSAEFINFLSKVVTNRVEVFLFSNKEFHKSEIPFVKDNFLFGENIFELPCSNIKNIKIDIDKQILVSKKLGRKNNSFDIINNHFRLVNLYSYYFKKIKPDLVVVWNGVTHSFQTSAVQVASNMGIDVIYLERGLIPGSVFYDTRGVNASSSLAKCTQFHLVTEKDYGYDFTLAKIRETIKKTGGGVVTKSSNSVDYKLPERFIFTPMQRDTDSNMLFNSPFVKNMYSLLRFLDSNYIDFNGTNFLIRPHPEDPSNHYTKKMNFNNLFKSSDGDISTLIDNSLAVMTVNSTVGFTSMIMGKPVIALGKSVYSGKNLCIEPASFEDIIKSIINLNSGKEKINNDAVNKFIYFAITRNHISFGDEEILEFQFEPFQKKLKVHDE